MWDVSTNLVFLLAAYFSFVKLETELMYYF
jgi:hypothetical protein